MYVYASLQGYQRLRFRRSVIKKPRVLRSGLSVHTYIDLDLEKGGWGLLILNKLSKETFDIHMYLAQVVSVFLFSVYG